MIGLCKRQLDDPEAEWEPPSEQDAAKMRKLGRKRRAAMDGELITPHAWKCRLGLAGMLAHQLEACIRLSHASRSCAITAA